MNYADKLQENYDFIANFIINTINNNDTIKWQKDFDTHLLHIPHNPITKTIYKGINALLLNAITLQNDYPTNQFITFNNCSSLDGFIKKGEKAISLIHKYPISVEEAKKIGIKVNLFNVTYDEEDRTKQITFLYKINNVFNVAQSTLTQEQIKEYQIKNKFPSKFYDFKKSSALQKVHQYCEEIIKNSKIPIHHSYTIDTPHYNVFEDKIFIPDKEQFKSADSYYSTLLHELGHATGHKDRLDRDLSGIFGTSSYAKEELKAELYSVIQSLELGIKIDIHNHTSYIKSWRDVLKQNSTNDIVKEALSQSCNMVNYVARNWYSDELKQTLKQNLEVNKSIISNHHIKKQQEKSKQRGVSYGR